MLQDTKSIQHISGIKIIELREGCGGRGETLYIVVTYIEGLPRSYYEERFTDIFEATHWYDNIA